MFKVIFKKSFNNLNSKLISLFVIYNIKKIKRTQGMFPAVKDE